MHSDMFRLCLQPSSSQFVVQNRYKWCAYDMESHIVCASFVSVLYYKLAWRWL